MKKNIFLIALCCMTAFFLVGCVSKQNKNNVENAKTEVDYSMYNFVGVNWIRDAECEEILKFLPNGEFRYSCACGNAVNDADIVESYSYDDATKTFTLNCYEEIEGMITEIKLNSCDSGMLELDFGGEVRVFYMENAGN